MLSTYLFLFFLLQWSNVSFSQGHYSICAEKKLKIMSTSIRNLMYWKQWKWEIYPRYFEFDMISNLANFKSGLTYRFVREAGAV